MQNHTNAEQLLSIFNEKMNSENQAEAIEAGLAIVAYVLNTFQRMAVALETIAENTAPERIAEGAGIQ